MLFRSLGVVTVGKINNRAELVRRLMHEENVLFNEMSSGTINDTELVATLISRRDNIPEGIKYAQEMVEGSMTMLISADGGLYAARDKLGRTPLSIGQKANGEAGYCASMESFAYINLGYNMYHELGPGEVVFLTAESMTSVFKPLEKMKMCTFLWKYYGFTTSDYEGVNVEEMRYNCGRNLAEQDRLEGTGVDADYIAGIPDSGTAHAIGYANESKIPFARPLIKYTPTWPRSFTPRDQRTRNLIAHMKLVPINALIKKKKLVLIDDSIVRGTQTRGLMDELFSFGATELHARIGCPPVLFGCKYLNFTRSSKENDTISRQSIIKLEGTDDISDGCVAKYAEYGTEKYRNMVEEIRKNLNFTSLGYLSLDGMLDAVGIDKCKLCTYCWDGKE